MKLLALSFNLVTYFMGNAIYAPMEINPTHGIYAQTMYITETTVDTKGTTSIEDDGGTIVLTDGNGNNWVVEQYPEDYFVGDYVAVLFEDNGTPNSIYDDIILEIRATGFCRVQ